MRMAGLLAFEAGVGRLRKELRAFTENRLAVRSEYEDHDDAGQWYRAYGNENWEFATTATCGGGMPASATRRYTSPGGDSGGTDVSECASARRERIQ